MIEIFIAVTKQLSKKKEEKGGERAQPRAYEANGVLIGLLLKGMYSQGKRKVTILLRQGLPNPIERDRNEKSRRSTMT